MKRLVSLLTLVLILASLGLGVSPVSAGVGGISVTVGCGTVDISGPGSGPGAPFPIYDLTTGLNVVGSMSFVDNGSSFTGHGTFNAPAGHILDIAGIIFTAMPCGNGGRYNPADGRIDPQAGDRLAVWCNASANPPNVDVWGVQDDSTGKSLGVITIAALKKAGGTVTVSGPLGSVTVTMSGNRFIAMWFGGPDFADGKGPFRKVFTCDFGSK